MTRYRAVSIDERNWTAQIFVRTYSEYVDISASPVFNTPQAAIAWAINWYTA